MNPSVDVLAWEEGLAQGQGLFCAAAEEGIVDVHLVAVEDANGDTAFGLVEAATDKFATGGVDIS